jgi:uncharacterized protein YcsI (UPF0317 family)
MLNKNISPQLLRELSSVGQFKSHTAGYCQGFIQANLVVLPQKYADDFELFCRKNPKPCPLLEKIGPGEYRSLKLAKGADIRSTIPKYKVFINGIPTQEVSHILDFYQRDQVFFLIGCSYSFENILLKAGIELRHISKGKNVSMFNTNIKLNSQGPFYGNMVVSMRPVLENRVNEAITLTARFPKMHGSPVHVGIPGTIGISDINNADYGENVNILENEVPLFWACGVTPQNILLNAKIPFAITHSPGFMFVSDLRDEHYVLQDFSEKQRNSHQ